MIDLQLIRKDSESVAAALKKKGAIVSFDELLEWDRSRRSLIAEVETLKAKRNKVSGEIPLYKKQGKDTTEIFKEMREIGDKISASDAEITALEEKINDFHGVYHVLGGVIAPSKGYGAAELDIDHLLERIENEGIKEVILATNPTLEGETTALFIAKLLEGKPVSVTRLGYGLPMGASLDYADSLTLEKALEGRRKL